MVRGQRRIPPVTPPGVNDGACALLLASETALSANDLQPLAGWSAWRRRALRRGLWGLASAGVRKVLAQTGLTLGQMDVIELNEALRRAGAGGDP